MRLVHRCSENTIALEVSDCSPALRAERPGPAPSYIVLLSSIAKCLVVLSPPLPALTQLLAHSSYPSLGTCVACAQVQGCWHLMVIAAFYQRGYKARPGTLTARILHAPRRSLLGG